ncbi:MAG: winged helix-turn-helix domain-containing protein [Bacteroidota bacterium]
MERKDILLKVWSDDSYHNSRNLDVYIKKIRDYFSADQKIKLITLRGVGYKLGVE